MENITDVDYRHAKRVFKNLNNNKNLGDYHDLKVIHYCLLMYLRILAKNLLKYMN